MEGNRRATFTLGALLLLVGGWFLAVQFVPDLAGFVSQYFDWPWFVIGFGLVFFLAAIFSGVTELSIPGFIFMGIGGILYYQNSTNDWESWSYMWALIPTSVGVGIFMSNLLKGRVRRAFSEARSPFFSGIIMFLIFGSFFRPLFNQTPLFGEYWPVVLIVIGLWLLVRTFLPGKRKKKVTVITEDTISPDELDGIAVNVDDEMDVAMEEMDVAMEEMDATLDEMAADVEHAVADIEETVADDEE